MDPENIPKKEKRRRDRKQLYFYLKVTQKDSNELLGYIADISTEGIMLLSKDRIDVDRIFSMKIEPYEELNMQSGLEFKAKSIWCEKDANPDYMVTGFEFISLDNTAMTKVNHLIKEYGLTM